MGFKLIHADTEPHVSEAGQTGGPEFSLGREASVRFTWETGNPEEPYVSVTETFYVQGRDEHGELVAIDDLAGAEEALQEWQAADRVLTARHRAGEVKWAEVELHESKRPIRFAVEVEIEWIAHSSLDDIGGTEIRSNTEGGVDPLDYLWIYDLEVANQRTVEHARRTIEQVNLYNPEEF